MAVLHIPVRSGAMGHEWMHARPVPQPNEMTSYGAIWKYSKTYMGTSLFEGKHTDDYFFEHLRIFTAGRLRSPIGKGKHLKSCF